MKTNTSRLAFSARLNEVLDEHGVASKGAGRQIAVGKEFGVTQNAVRKWLEGEGVPELTRSIEIAQRYRVCVEWLLTGNGSKYPDVAGEDQASALQQRYHSADPATKALIELSLELPLTVPLPASVTPTLRNLLNGVRLMAEQNISRT